MASVDGGWDHIFKTDKKHCGPQNLDAWCGDMPLADRELARRAYRGSIAFVDEQIGRIMDVMEDEGLLEDTFVLFTAIMETGKEITTTGGKGTLMSSPRTSLGCPVARQRDGSSSTGFCKAGAC